MFEYDLKFLLYNVGVISDMDDDEIKALSADESVPNERTPLLENYTPRELIESCSLST